MRVPLGPFGNRKYLFGAYIACILITKSYLRIFCVRGGPRHKLFPGPTAAVSGPGGGDHGHDHVRDRGRGYGRGRVRGRSRGRG